MMRRPFRRILKLRFSSIVVGVMSAVMGIVPPALSAYPQVPSYDSGMFSGPDGSRRIVYESWLGGDADIYSASGDGSDPQQHTRTGLASEMTPAWSPDGSQIAYISNGPQEGIYVANADGSSPRRVFNGPGYEWFPSWSPDGRRIAFASWDPVSFASELFIVGIHDRRLRQITRERSDFSPSWSPDGKWIAFVRFEYEADARHLYLVKPDGSRLIRRTQGSIEAFRPVWSPDSNRIAFQGWNRLDSTVRPDDIYVVDALEGKPRRLTEGVDYDGLPCWSPDGTEVAFSRSVVTVDAWVRPAEVGYWAQSPADLFAVTLEGSYVRRITSTPQISEETCDWS